MEHSEETPTHTQTCSPAAKPHVKTVCPVCAHLTPAPQRQGLVQEHMPLPLHIPCDPCIYAHVGPHCQGHEIIFLFIADQKEKKRDLTHIYNFLMFTEAV